jgi:integrase
VEAVETPDVVRGTPSSFEAYARRWLARGGVYGELRPRTRELYQRQLDRFLIPTFGRLALQDITPDAVRSWYASMDPAHPRQRRQVYALLATIMGTAVEDRKIDVSPCTMKQRGEKKATTQVETVSITDEELETMAQAMPEHLRLVVLLAGWCGLRQGEVLALTRQDLDVDAGVVSVTKAITRTSEGVVVGDPKTHAGTRAVPIPPHLIPVVTDHLARHVRPEPDALVFRTGPGHHLTSTSLYRFWYPAREAAGHPELRFHDLRHVAASRLARLGAGPSDVARFLGHGDRGITAMQVYIHAGDARQVELAALASAAFEATRIDNVTPIRGRKA